MKKFKNWLVLFVVLMFIWILLNNSLQAGILIPGLIIALLISLFACRSCDVFADLNITPKSFAYTFVFLWVFFVELVKSNLDVISRVLSPSLPINPGFVEVKTTLKSKYARMILANSITLTPGTLTVEVADESFFIHWINVESEDIEAASNKIVKKFEKYLEVIYG
jgi:multicomponent Na+:H+ antiporter subunit E